MREILREAQAAKFILQPNLKPENYVMTDSLANVETWQAMTYDSNSGDEGDQGDMGKVGYIMISKKDNTIIPMSRGDEHHRGFDTLYKLARKYKFDARDYVPIWPYGNNYIYDKSEIEPYLITIRKYLEYGGKDGLLKGGNDYRKKIITLSHFVATNGDMTINPKQLAPIGKHILETLAKLVQAKEAAQAAPIQKEKVLKAQAFLAAFEFLKLLNKYISVLPNDLDSDVIKKFWDATAELRKTGDIEGLDRLFFTFNGIKNILHNALRATHERLQPGGEKDFFQDDITIAIFGDLEQAIDMLGRF